MNKLSAILSGTITLAIACTLNCLAQKNAPAPKPVYADPVYDGAADPVIIWNPKEKAWWMFYTNRRATVNDSTGVRWVHGTRIGMDVYQSDDLLTWKRNARILEAPGKGKDDGAIGGHCDVVVNDGKAWVFYFTHPGRAKANPAPSESVAARRSVIQVAELQLKNGVVNCDRDQPASIRLRADKKPE